MTSTLAALVLACARRVAAPCALAGSDAHPRAHESSARQSKHKYACSIVRYTQTSCYTLIHCTLTRVVRDSDGCYHFPPGRPRDNCDRACSGSRRERGKCARVRHESVSPHAYEDDTSISASASAGGPICARHNDAHALRCRSPAVSHVRPSRRVVSSGTSARVTQSDGVHMANRSHARCYNV